MNSASFIRLRFLLLAAALGSTAALPTLRAADEIPAPAVDAYTAAVQAYVTAATKEVSAIRAEVNANEKLGRKERYAPVKEALQNCEELVSRLKGSGRSDFDLIKSQYEKTRNALLEKLATARQG